MNHFSIDPSILFSIYSYFPAWDTNGEESGNTIESLGFCRDKAAWLEELGYTFEAVKKRVQEGFTPDEIVNAVTVKLLHDKVEIAAYSALQRGIGELGLKTNNGVTAISTEESRCLLHNHVKTAAHKVMWASDGYVTLRGEYLNQKQISPIVRSVNIIVTDRDAKLTNAAYESLEALVAALDDHNTTVNAILFNAWGVPDHPKDHLTAIKEQAGYEGAKESHVKRLRTGKKY